MTMRRLPELHWKVSFATMTLLLLSVILVYWAGLSGPFLFDDYPNLVDNDWLNLRANTLVDLRSAALSSESSILRRPVAMLSFAFQRALSGELDAFTSKAINLGIHAACVLMLFFVTREIVAAPLLKLTGAQRRFVPLLTAAIWGLNPLQVSTVLYVVQRMALLAALFSFAAFFIYLKWRNYWVDRAPTPDQVCAGIILFLLLAIVAVFAKENAILIFWLVAAAEVTLFRGFIAGSTSKGMRTLSCAAFVLPTALVLFVVLNNLDWISAGYAVRPFGLAERAMTELRVLWLYIYWFLLPQLDALGMFHDDVIVSTSWTQPITTAAAGVAWLGVLTVSLSLYRRFPELLFCVLFFLIAHSIESSVLALELIFEHRNYIPGFALALLLSVAGCRAAAWLTQRGVSVPLVSAPFVVLILALALTTTLRAATWSSELSLSRSSVESHPASPRSGLFYGNALLKVSQAANDQRAASQFLALAKHEFEIVAQSGKEQLASLAMLYVIDEQFYPDSGSSEDWLTKIEESVQAPLQSATDFVAMRTLVDCFEVESCSLERERLLCILSAFGENFWRQAALSDLVNRVLKSDSTDGEDRLAKLTAALEKTPQNVELNYLRMEALLNLGRFASAQAQAVELMSMDTQRRQLPILREIFAPTEATLPRAENEQ